MADTNIRAVITAKDEASSVLSGFTKSLDSAKAGSFALLGGLTAVAAGAVLTVNAFEESQNELAQLDAVLKSTASVAGVTSDAAIKLSESLQSSTTFSHAQVLSAEDLLLTFTKIGKDIFPQATSTVLDMATALGEDTKSAAIQLGKALQDPVLGITALRRVGVNFNDAQKEVIKNLVATGQSAKAQQLILKELNTEFGGSAAKAATTFSGQLKQLGNIFTDFEEQIGGAIAGGLKPFVQGLMDWVKNMGGAQKIGDDFLAWLQKLQPYLPIIAGAILGGLVPAFWALLAPIVASTIALLPWMAAGAAVVLIAKALIEHFGGWKAVLDKIKPVVKDVFASIQLLVTGDFKHGMFDPSITEDSKLVDWLITTRDTMISIASFVKTEFIVGWNNLKGIINATREAFTFLLPSLTALWNQIVNNLWPVIETKLIPALNNLWNNVIKPLIPVIGVLLVGAIWLLVNGLNFAIQVVSFLVNALSGFINFIAAIPTAIGTAFTVVGGWLTYLRDNFFQIIGEIIGFFATLPIKLPVFVVEAVAAIIGLLTKVNWGAVIKFLVDAWVDGWKMMYDAAVKVLDYVTHFNWGGLLMGVGKSIANAIIDVVQGAINGAFQGIPGHPHVNLPHFAAGVQNFTGGLAVVGEKGPELVSLPKGSNVYPNGTSPGGATVNITINSVYSAGTEMEKRKFATDIFNALKDVASSKNTTVGEMLA